MLVGRAVALAVAHRESIEVRESTRVYSTLIDVAYVNQSRNDRNQDLASGT